MKHLDAAALRALAAREPEAVAHFREHLAAPCEACEEFLARHPGTDGLDGLVDALLLGLAPPKAPALDEPGWARLRRALRTSPRSRRWVAGAVALAACLVGLVLVPRVLAPAPKQGPWDGVKGPGRLALELAAVARAEDGRLRRLDRGATVSPEELLLLRYHATEAGQALLFQQVEGEPPELLGHFPLQAGTHDLEGAQGLAGVSLSGQAGPVTLWLVASALGQAPSAEQARQALEAGGAPGKAPLSLARFDVHVHNGQNPR